MALITKTKILGLDEFDAYVKILSINIQNREQFRVGIHCGFYISEASRRSGTEHMVGGRQGFDYIEDPENPFFTDELIAKNGLFGEAYRYLKTLDTFEDSKDT